MLGCIVFEPFFCSRQLIKNVKKGLKSGASQQKFGPSYFVRALDTFYSKQKTFKTRIDNRPHPTFKNLLHTYFYNFLFYRFFTMPKYLILPLEIYSIHNFIIWISYSITMAWFRGETDFPLLSETMFLNWSHLLLSNL